jgi:hypothetical protein
MQNYGHGITSLNPRPKPSYNGVVRLAAAFSPTLRFARAFVIASAVRFGIVGIGMAAGTRGAKSFALVLTLFG